MTASAQIANNLNRARVLLAAMQAIFKFDSQTLNYVEIGTAFKADEGLSTLLAKDF